MVRLAVLLLVLTTTGCVPVMAGIAAAGGVANAVHSFYQVGGDILAVTAAACQRYAVAAALNPRDAAAADPWYSRICNRISPDNRDITVGTAAWVGEGAGRLSKPPPDSSRR